jgi:hypothetical protein
MSAGRTVIVEGVRVTHSSPGPYTARSASDTTDDWPLWYVVGPDGRYNGMSFPDQPGAKFTDKDSAKAIADALNDAAAKRQ